GRRVLDRRGIKLRTTTAALAAFDPAPIENTAPGTFHSATGADSFAAPELRRNSRSSAVQSVPSLLSHHVCAPHAGSESKRAAGQSLPPPAQAIGEWSARFASQRRPGNRIPTR